MRNKTAEESKRCLAKILSLSSRKPKVIYSDRGKEFMGIYRSFLKDNKIIQLFTNVSHKFKASTVERFNRTLKEKLWRLLHIQILKITLMYWINLKIHIIIHYIHL